MARRASEEKEAAAFQSWARRFPRLVLASLCLLLTFSLESRITPSVQANRTLPTDLSYGTETYWLLPGIPDLSATSGYIPHNFSNSELIITDGDHLVHGFQPGKAYPEMSVRSLAWSLAAAQYYYPDAYLREPIEAYLRHQPRTGAIAGRLTPDGQRHKQTLASDEETSLIHAAYQYYNMTYNTAWLQKEINGPTVIERLNLAADWLYTHRFDKSHQLLWRGSTLGWGTNLFSETSADVDDNLVDAHLHISIYDQAMAYLAFIELAKMNAAVGNLDQADAWQDIAEALKIKTNAHLWQADKGFYRHQQPPFNATDRSVSPTTQQMVTIANVLAIFGDLTNAHQKQAILENLERVRLEAGVTKPGLSIYPYYSNQATENVFKPAVIAGHAQNGGVWDWWGGLQIKAEFEQGFAEMGHTHLQQVANDWQKHPGNIIEWQSTTDQMSEGSHYDSAAAGTMGSAIIESFFGLQLIGSGLTMHPRLGLNDGYIRIYQPATDRYAAMSYDWNQKVTKIGYGTNAKGLVELKVLKLRSEQINVVNIDDHPIPFTLETIGQDSYIVFTAPTGQHRIDIIKGAPAKQPDNQIADSNETTAQEGAVTQTEWSITKRETPSVAPNSIVPRNGGGLNRDDMGEADDHITLADPMSNPIAARNAREAWTALLNFISTGLIILTSLILIGLVILRRLKKWMLT